MKLTTTILFCVILTLQYNSADGLVKDLFGRIKESVDGSVNKVQQDLNIVFQPNENKKQQESKDESSNIHFVEDDSKEDFDAGAARQQLRVTTPSTISTTRPAQSGGTNGTTEKDGRENFSGGCVTGFMRTADGRCKPTF